MRKSVFDTALDTAKKIKRLPLDIVSLCQEAGIDLLSVHELALRSGLTDVDVFGIIGNADGAVFSHSGRYVIVYNDAAPPNRVRFTLCEEIGHVLLGHSDDSTFNAFTQEYSPALYAQYEAEAKLFAGLVLCPPNFYFSHSRLSVGALADVCGISRSCASTICANYDAFSADIRHNMRFYKLPALSPLRALRYWN